MTAVAGARRDVKSVLMDQEIIAGVGNIYSDEILFQARMNPAERMDGLSPAQLKRLFVKTREVLETAILHGAGSEQFIERMPKGSLLPELASKGRQDGRPHRLLLSSLSALLARALRGLDASATSDERRIAVLERRRKIARNALGRIKLLASLAALSPPCPAPRHNQPRLTPGRAKPSQAR
jgi:hypothetical protein